MNKTLFTNYLLTNPLVMAVNSDELLEKAIVSDNKIVFVLYGNICNIASIIKKLKNANKIVIIHIDLIQGLSNKEIVVDFIKKTTEADGIISTKPLLLKRAKELKMISGERSFMIDSMAFATMKNHLDSFKPDFIEVLPGISSKIITEIKKITTLPIVVGGLITSKEDIKCALNAGAIAVSLTNNKLW